MISNLIKQLDINMRLDSLTSMISVFGNYWFENMNILDDLVDTLSIKLEKDTKQDVVYGTVD